MKLQFDVTKQYAVALEGGGAKGAYEIGVWKALKDAGVSFHAVAGASVGAINGALMVMDDIETAIDLWENIRFSHVMNVDDEQMRKLYNGELRGKELKDFVATAIGIMREGGVDIQPLRHLLSELIDEEKIRQSATEFYLVTYSLTDKAEIELDAKELADGKLGDMILASAYFPAFRRQSLDGKVYIDGCLVNLVPISCLLNRGYQDIIVIRIYGIGVEKRVKIPPEVSVTTIAPTEKLGGLLQFDSGQSRIDMKRGYFDGQRMLYGLKGESYYIDQQWEERQAYAVLWNVFDRYHKKKGKEMGLRPFHEEFLPRLAKKLKAKGGYDEILILLLEQMAKEMELSPFLIYTEEELLREIFLVREKKPFVKGMVSFLPYISAQ